jgi:hypothetical protein
VALRKADLPTDKTFAVSPHGGELTGQATMDLCNGTFPSEAKRVARFEVEADTPDKHLYIANENVFYSRPEDGESALQELRVTIANCPPNTFMPGPPGGPAVKYDIKIVPDSQLDGLAADHVGVSGLLTLQNGPSTSLAGIYQRRGRLMVALYGHTIDDLLPFAHLLNNRLEALPASQVGL